MRKISVTSEHSTVMLWVSAISSIVLGFIFLFGVVISAIFENYWLLLCVIPALLMFWKAKRIFAILDKG